MSKRHSFTLHFHKARCIIVQNKRAKHTFATLEDEQCCYIPFLGSWPLTNILLAMIPFQNKLGLVFPHMLERACRVYQSLSGVVITSSLTVTVIVPILHTASPSSMMVKGVVVLLILSGDVAQAWQSHLTSPTKSALPRVYVTSSWAVTVHVPFTGCVVILLTKPIIFDPPFKVMPSIKLPFVKVSFSTDCNSSFARTSKLTLLFVPGTVKASSVASQSRQSAGATQQSVNFEVPQHPGISASLPIGVLVVELPLLKHTRFPLH